MLIAPVVTNNERSSAMNRTDVHAPTDSSIPKGTDAAWKNLTEPRLGRSLRLQILATLVGGTLLICSLAAGVL